MRVRERVVVGLKFSKNWIIGENDSVFPGQTMPRVQKIPFKLV